MLCQRSNSASCVCDTLRALVGAKCREAHYSEKHCLKIHRAALKRILNDTFHGGTMIS